MLWAFVLLVSLVAQAAPQPESTGLIRGRVIEKESGRPLSGALVALQPPTGHPQQAVADDRGEFEFSRLATGPHTLRATAGEHRASHVTLPYLRAGDTSATAVFLSKAGEVRENIEIVLPRAMAISGQVLDDAGTAAANVVVHLKIVESVAGFSPSQAPATDDRGHFRVFGIPAGRYVVCADPEIGPRFGLALTRRAQHTRTCTGEIAVTNEDVSGMLVPLRKVETYTIRGRLVGEDGNVPALAGVTLTLIDDERARSVSNLQQRTPDGSFVISDVAAGKYELSAFGGFRPWIRTDDPSQRQWTGMTLEISTADVDGVVLPLARGATLRGRVTYEGSPAPHEAGRELQIRAQPVTFPSAHQPTAIPAKIGEEGAFELTGLFGPLVLHASVPSGHMVKSITYRGRDIHEVPTVFGGDPAHEATVLLTNRMSDVSGRVVDQSGAPTPIAWVFVFPVDPARWKAYGGGWQRVTDGRYRMPRLVGGEYFVVAVTGGVGPFSRPDYELLSQIAERVVLADGERRTVDLTVQSLPRVPR